MAAIATAYMAELLLLRDTGIVSLLCFSDLREEMFRWSMLNPVRNAHWSTETAPLKRSAFCGLISFPKKPAEIESKYDTFIVI